LLFFGREEGKKTTFILSFIYPSSRRRERNRLKETHEERESQRWDLFQQMLTISSGRASVTSAAWIQE